VPTTNARLPAVSPRNPVTVAQPPPAVPPGSNNPSPVRPVVTGQSHRKHSKPPHKPRHKPRGKAHQHEHTRH
jgi:hypothetical protein